MILSSASFCLFTIFLESQSHSSGRWRSAVEIGGAPVAVRSPSDAMKLGIGMVHQEFMLIPGFTIAENIKLNREPLKPGLLGMLFGQKLQTLDAGILKQYYFVGGMPEVVNAFIEHKDYALSLIHI